jgi:hypothetical protein
MSFLVRAALNKQISEDVVSTWSGLPSSAKLLFCPPSLGSNKEYYLESLSAVFPFSQIHEGIVAQGSLQDVLAEVEKNEREATE